MRVSGRPWRRPILDCYQQPDEADMREALRSAGRWPTTVGSGRLSRHARSMPGLTPLRKCLNQPVTPTVQVAEWSKGHARPACPFQTLKRALPQ